MSNGHGMHKGKSRDWLLSRTELIIDPFHLIFIRSIVIAFAMVFLEIKDLDSKRKRLEAFIGPFIRQVSSFCIFFISENNMRDKFEIINAVVVSKVDKG